MKKSPIIHVFVFLVSCQFFAQNFQDIVKVSEAETVEDLDEICQSVNQLGFTNTPEEVDQLITEITEAGGVKRKFALKECSNINNAVAKNLTIEGEEKRFIIYDGDWMNQMTNKTGNNWAGTLVLAHEIGHHMNGHSMNNGVSTPEIELEADYYAGRALANMGAQEADILAVTKTLPANASFSHPGRSEREGELLAGFRSVKNKAITVKVQDEDINKVGRDFMNNVSASLKDTQSLNKDKLTKLLQGINLAKNKFYGGEYTEDMRYFEAIIYTSLEDAKSAITAYTNYLSIENLENIDRINQITDLLAKNNDRTNVFFTNLDVLYALSKSYFKEKKYRKSIALGNQFLAQTLEESKKSEITKLIADSEFKFLMEGDGGLTNEELLKRGISYYENSVFDKALGDLSKMASKNNSTAQYYMAQMYFHGYGVTSDKKIGLNWYNKSAQGGNMEAQFRLGEIYTTGEGGLDQDYDDALFWLKQAKASGHTKASGLISEIESKKAIKENEREEVNKPEPKEEKVETIAMKMVKADSFFDSEIYSDAYVNYIDAANSGNAKAQSRIAWMLYKGKGVKKDKDKALDWWHKAALQGDVESINYLTRLGEW